MISHWAATYVGRPWEFGKEGPDSYDCWGFVRAVQAERFGVSVPALPVPETWQEAHAMLQNHEERANWERVTAPQEGDMALMARNRLPVHIGVVIEANGKLGVLHCIQLSGVVFNSMASLRSCGWGSIQYYRRNK